MTASATIRRWARLPVHVAALLSGAKSFRDNPVIGSNVLNRLGLHAVRVVFAHGATQLRRLWFMAGLDAEDRRAFARDGYLIKRNFLPPELFGAVEAELRAYRGPAFEEMQGDTMTRRVMLDPELMARMPACRAVIQHPPYRRLLRYVAGRARVPFQWMQEIRSGVIDGPRDPQCALHSDTFHPTMKSWLFMDDVDERNGPFTYVPGSHRLTRKRLQWEYRQSLIGARLPTLSARGSLRIEEQELSSLGLPAPVALSCPRNTLVIADTHGFHRRGPAAKGGIRLELWSMSRTHPFNPLPGLPLALLDRLDIAGLRIFYRLRDYARRKRPAATV